MAGNSDFLLINHGFVVMKSLSGVTTLHTCVGNHRRIQLSCCNVASRGEISPEDVSTGLELFFTKEMVKHTVNTDPDGGLTVICCNIHNER